MSNQAWNDWEEYNHGLQGMPTGSMQNKIRRISDKKETANGIDEANDINKESS